MDKLWGGIVLGGSIWLLAVSCAAGFVAWVHWSDKRR